MLVFEIPKLWFSPLEPNSDVWIDISLFRTEIMSALTSQIVLINLLLIVISTDNSEIIRPL